MSGTGKSFSFVIASGFLLVVLTLGLAFLLAGYQRGRMPPPKLPIIGPVADFTLTNQEGRVVSLADLRGHVWVADIIFTRCGGPCPRMTRQMRELQAGLTPADPAKLVSLTTDPEFDTPPILRAYAERFGADATRWSFLTGTKKQIGALAIDSLKLTAIEKKPEERQADNDLFVHSTIFVVVDRRAQLRGVFETDGEGVDWGQAKQKITAAIRVLEREP
jgi:protein SCO1